MKTIAGLLSFAIAAQICAQEPPTRPVKPAKHVPVSTSKEPVTQSEARAIFARMIDVLKATGEKSLPGEIGIAESSKPVSRTQIVIELARVYDSSKPAFKITPKPLAFDKHVLRLSDAKARARLEQLIAAGCIGPIGPLATGPADTLTVQQFGDTIGYFLARIAQIEHLPSPKWSPALGAGS